MARRRRRNHAPTIKAPVALAAIKCDKTLAALAQQFAIQPNKITDWKTYLLERMAQLFGGPRPGSAPDLEALHSRIVQLTLKNNPLWARSPSWAS